MATKANSSEEQRVQNAHIRQRQALNNAYTSILAQQNIQSFHAYTFEEAMDAQIDRIEGTGTDIRPNLLARVDRIENEITKVANELKQVPPAQFLDSDSRRDVNT